MNTINPETGEVTQRSIKAVATKIALAMADMEDHAPRDRINKHFGYNYTSISQYIAHVRPALVKYGLVIVPSLVKLTDSDDAITDVVMKYTIIDKDSGEYVEAVMQGRGQDVSRDGRRLDKGPYKAYSGAFKYFLAETFMIASGDDPDETPTQAQKTNTTRQSVTTKKVTVSENDKGKVSNDQMTAYWVKVKELGLTNGKDILGNYGGDPVKALAVVEGMSQVSPETEVA